MTPLIGVGRQRINFFGVGLKSCPTSQRLRERRAVFLSSGAHLRNTIRSFRAGSTVMDPPVPNAISEPALGDKTTSSADTLLQYIVVRSDLLEKGWSVGSVIAQACHASVAAVCENLEHPCVQLYLSDVERMHKVVLAINDEVELRTLSLKLCSKNVPHKLWVEEPEKEATAVASMPAPKGAVGKLFRGLKLFDPLNKEKLAV